MRIIIITVPYRRDRNMTTTQKLYKVLSIGTDRQVMQQRLKAAGLIERGEAAEATRRIYLVASYILRKRGVYMGSTFFL
jgi:hypothetical protein